MARKQPQTRRSSSDFTGSRSTANSVASISIRKKSGNHGRFPCSIPGCFAVANHLSSMCRHKWGHLPQHLLPTCRGHLPNGSPCPVRYQGRADTMKRHWLTHHINEGPYVQDRYPPFEDLWRLVGEGEIVLSPQPFRPPPVAPPQPSRVQIKQPIWQSSPTSHEDTENELDSSDSEEEIHPNSLPVGAEPYSSPYIANERQFYVNDRHGTIMPPTFISSPGYNLPPILGAMESVVMTKIASDRSPVETCSSGPGPGYIRAAISPLELSLVSHPPADHPIVLNYRIPHARSP